MPCSRVPTGSCCRSRLVSTLLLPVCRARARRLSDRAVTARAVPWARGRELLASRVVCLPLSRVSLSSR
ncbi:hypothetical protein D3C78_1625550 [compost metagenome]